MSKWHPITTAPHDGTRIIANNGYGHVEVVRHRDGKWWDDNGCSFNAEIWLAGWGDIAALMRVVPFYGEKR